MIGFVCFLTVLHFTTGQDDVYDAQNCGLTQIRHAQISIGTRVRWGLRAIVDSNNEVLSIRKIRNEHLTAASIDVERSFNDNSTTNDGKPHRELDGDDLQDYDDYDFMQEKVMGGRRAERGELPWAVLLFTPLNVCGGTLVSRRHVITAAHCFWASKEMKMGQCSTTDKYDLTTVIHDTEVYIGGTCALAGQFGCTKSDIGRRYDVARAFYGNYFSFGCKGTHDIAILELKEDVPKTINHICLPFMHQLEEIEDPYLRLRSFGWGLDPPKHGRKDGSPYLQIADLGAKLREEDCNRMKYFKAEDTFCTTSSQQIVCQGDSGGGLTTRIRGRNYLLGVVSYGPDCNKVAEKIDRRSLQVHTDIMHYKELIKTWIQNSYREKAISHKDISPFTPQPYYRLSQMITRRKWIEGRKWIEAFS